MGNKLNGCFDNKCISEKQQISLSSLPRITEEKLLGLEKEKEEIREELKDIKLEKEKIKDVEEIDKNYKKDKKAIHKNSESRSTETDRMKHHLDYLTIKFDIVKKN